MYLEVIFRPSALTGRRLWSDQARKLVAEACHGEKLNPALFNRGDDGKTLQGRYGDDRNGEGMSRPPAIVFDGGHGFIRLYGLGASGREILSEAAPTILRALIRAHGPTSFDMQSGTCALEYKDYGVLHRVHVLLLSKKPGVVLRGPVTTERCRDAIRRQITRGLIAQARWLGGGLEGKVPLDEDIDILEGEPVPVPIQDGIYAAAFKNVVFAMPLQAQGPWLAGHLRSRGYGLIRYLEPTRRAP